MRLRATCHRCERDFLLFELYHADPRDRDRCPRCGANLGFVGVAALARSADEAVTALLRAFEDLAARRSTFTVHESPWVPQLVEAMRRTSVVAEADEPALARAS